MRHSGNSDIIVNSVTRILHGENSPCKLYDWVDTKLMLETAH